MKKRILKLVSLWAPPVLWALLIFRFSSGTVPVASPVYWQDFAVKKTGHVLLFGTLAVFIYRGLLGQGLEKRKAAIWAVILATFYGATDEFHQMFTQGRESRVRDIFFDGFGGIGFVGLIYYFLPKLPKELKMLAANLGLL